MVSSPSCVLVLSIAQRFSLVLCQRLPPVPTVAAPAPHHSLLIPSRWPPSRAREEKPLAGTPRSSPLSSASTQGLIPPFPPKSWPPPPILVPLGFLLFFSPGPPLSLPASHLTPPLLSSARPRLSLTPAVYSRKKRCRLCLCFPFMPPPLQSGFSSTTELPRLHQGLPKLPNSQCPGLLCLHTPSSLRGCGILARPPCCRGCSSGLPWDPSAPAPCPAPFRVPCFLRQRGRPYLPDRGWHVVDVQ